MHFLAIICLAVFLLAAITLIGLLTPVIVMSGLVLAMMGVGFFIGAVVILTIALVCIAAGLLIGDLMDKCRTRR